MSQVSIEHGDNVTPRRERPGLLVYSVLARKLRNQILRDILADLIQCGQWFLRHWMGFGNLFRIGIDAVDRKSLIRRQTKQQFRVIIADANDNADFRARL